jgi:hypothetical protein
LMFLEAPASRAVAAFVEWAAPHAVAQGRTLEVREVHGNLETAFRSLEPLTSVENRRELFVPTRSQWTAYFDNGWQGTDPSAVKYLCLKLRCRGMRVDAVPHTLREDRPGASGRWGAAMFDVYGPKPNPIQNYIRSVVAMNDGGRWIFEEYGEPFPFEQVERYKERIKRKRLTFEMLRDYSAALGVRPFDEDFYLPDGVATLVEMLGPTYPNMREYTLEEARAGYS